MQLQDSAQQDNYFIKFFYHTQTMMNVLIIFLASPFPKKIMV
jgi:hypothetical protein